MRRKLSTFLGSLSTVGDSYRYELSKRRTLASGRKIAGTIRPTRTEETPEKQAAIKEIRRKATARQMKLWL